MQRLILTLCVGALVVIVPVPSNAEPVVVRMCPVVNSQNPDQNFAIDPGFENCSTNAQTSCEGEKRKGSCELLPTAPVISWKIHSDKSGSKVTSKCVPIEVSEKKDKRLPKVVSNGNKGGVFLELPNLKSDAKRIHSTWVWVRSGQVAIAQQGGNTRPASWDTKEDGWERPQNCTNRAMRLILLLSTMR